ncbi:hAT family dimerization domain-containing protein [Actinidia rufa]|uniref:HAT family dimerization domain-containing protein n=1 Tax=Actinidia rufa TaxID=165716 RepID=A0A7J0FGX0_9ERIC|nr:hAT family dimerization domain-containing protein [Actinidia rufa]
MGLLDEAAGVLLGVTDVEFVPSSLLFKMLSRDLLKANRLELFWKVFEAMSKANVAFDVYACTNMVNAHSKVGNVKEAKKVLVEMRDKGCNPNVGTYNVVIGGLCRAGLHAVAIETKKSMVEKGLVPDSYTHATLINGFCAKRRSKEAKMVLVEMTDLSLKDKAQEVVNEMIEGYCRGRDMIRAFKLLEEMERASDVLAEMVAKGLKPNAVVYTTLMMSSCSRSSKDGRRKDLLGRNVGERIKDECSYLWAFNDGYSKVGEMQFADRWALQKGEYHGSLFRVLRYACTTGLVPDVSIYNSLISGFCKQGDLEKACELHEETCSKRITPNIVTCNIFINRLLKAVKTERAKVLFDGISQKGSTPNAVTYATMIDGYCKSENVMPNHITYTTLIDYHCKEGMMQEAKAVFRDAGEESEPQHRNLHNTSSAPFRDMLAKGLKPDKITYYVMLDAYCKEVNLVEACVKGRNVGEGRSNEWNAIARGYQTAGDMDKAAKVLESMVRFGWVSESANLSDLIDGNLTDADFPEAVRN